MCGAFGITKPQDITDRFQADPFGRWQRSYNIRPGQPAVIITRNSPNKGHIATFGFIPSWSKESKPKIMPINARDDTVAISGLFKAAFLHSRCVIPAEFWYEWVRVDVDGETIKQPYAFKIKNQKMFGFAGIYSKREDAEGKSHYTFAIITTKPNKSAAKIHNRMPVVLHKDDENIWLNPESKPKELTQLLRSYEDKEMIIWKVSREVNNAQNDGENLIKPIK